MTRTDHVPVTSAHLPLARALRATLEQHYALSRRARTVIGVGGESGSGKSVTAAAIAQLLDADGMPAAVLHQDDWYRLPPRDNHAARERDLGHLGPSEVDQPRLRAMIAAFQAGEGPVAAPLLDFPGNRFLEQQYDFRSTRVLLLEGTYVLGLPDLDVRIFMAATHADAADRRRERAREVDTPFIQQVLTIEHELIAPYAATADIVVDRDFAIVRTP